MSKETYYSVKRDLLQRQKRPTTVSKETYYSVKRDLLHTDLFRVEEGVIEGVNFFFPCNVEKQKNKRRHESQDTDRPLRNRRGCYRAPPFSEVCQGTADIWHCNKKKRCYQARPFSEAHQGTADIWFCVVKTKRLFQAPPFSAARQGTADMLRRV